MPKNRHPQDILFQNDVLQIDLVGTADCLWRYASADAGASFTVTPPVFEVDGRAVAAAVTEWRENAPVTLAGGGIEVRAVGILAADLNLSLEFVLRSVPDSPVVRFRYALHSKTSHRLTRSSGSDALVYLTSSFAEWPDVTEVQLAEFNERVHSYCLVERPVSPGSFEAALTFMGPLLIARTETHARLLAYEHGSQVPDAFLHYRLGPDCAAALSAVKGNYHHGQQVAPGRPFETVWLQAALVEGDETALAAAYRDFVLRGQSANPESRKPYIFYNTWNYQERLKHWQKKPYLSEMSQERMLAEVDVAHRMGIDVFVIDTGWYEKTGDWRVSRSRFPDGLASVRERLKDYGMKLGLWFNPTVAAVSSVIRRTHEDCLMTRGGRPDDPCQVWETEASQGLCLVSRYADAFADELIRLAQEVGVTYFKWDAVGQYGCDDPGHDHGTAENTPKERADRYAFELPRAMTRVVDKLCTACPEAIVDFDVTEGGRAVGLGFLSAGKYFLINNGPYSSNYDLPIPADGNPNLFFWPGPARAWICRTPLTYDKWVPSILFLTHYLPDDQYRSHDWAGGGEMVQTEANQWISLASLVLGQNGVWGDLLGISDTGVARFSKVLSHYKQVRDDITRATLLRTGDVGGSPEVYEKIDGATGRGVVSLFAGTPGRYTYITKATVTGGCWQNDGVTVFPNREGQALLDVTFTAAGAKIVFFGVNEVAACP